MARQQQNRNLRTSQQLKITAWSIGSLVVLFAGLFFIRPNYNDNTALHKVRVYATKIPLSGTSGTATAASTHSTTINQLVREKKSLDGKKNLTPADRALQISVEKRLRLWREVDDLEGRIIFRAQQPGFSAGKLQDRIDYLKAEIKLENDRIRATE